MTRPEISINEIALNITWSTNYYPLIVSKIALNHHRKMSRDPTKQVTVKYSTRLVATTPTNKLKSFRFVLKRKALAWFNV